VTAAAPPAATRSRTAVLATMCTAVVLVVAGVSSLNVALPSIASALEADQTQLQWIVDAYALVLAALLLPFGALGDRLGRKKLMVAGLVVMVGGAVASALAGSPEALVVARAVSGLGAALVFPGTLSTITNVFPPDQRGRAVGAWAAAASVGGILGLLASGALVEAFWYGSVFVAFAGASALVLVALAVVVPDTSDPAHANLDPLGSLLSALGVGAVVLGVIEGPVKGWTSAFTFTSLAVGAVALAGFVLWELRTPRPILDVRLFARRAFAVGSASVFVQFLVAFGFFFLGAQFVAYVFGYGPLQTGLSLLPIAVLLVPLSSRAPALAARYGRGPVGAAGLALIAVGLVLFAGLGAGAAYWQFALALVVFGAGMGLAASPATEAIVESLPMAKQGVASAVNDTAREVGGALGIALLGSVFNSAYRSSVSDALAGAPDQVVEAVKASPGIGLEVAGRVGEQGQALAATVVGSFTDGWHLAVLVAAGVAAVAAVAMAVFGPRRAAAAADVLDEPGVPLAGLAVDEA
jgi:EmrB/QacA subfamily drug resistance transporter